MVANHFFSAVLQILVFTLIPYLFFKLKKRSGTSFLKYIGLYKPTSKSIMYASVTAILFLIAAIGIVFIDENIKQTMLSSNSVTGHLHQMGLNEKSLTILITVAFFKTAFAEEVIFRGFIAKELISKYGLYKGNNIQAMIFGTIHLLLFWFVVKATIGSTVFIFIFSTCAGWSIGYINEKMSNGSIIPGWIAHGVGNALGYFFISFMIS